jgi:hypothetical protein
MDFEISPHIGVGPLRFGMTPAEVRGALDSPSELTDKSRSQTPTDYFSGLGLFAYYKDSGICRAIEFGGPATPTYRGRSILRQPYSEIEHWVRSIDPGFIRDIAGFKTHRFGFGVYAPASHHAPQLPIESVIVFDELYWQSRP